LVFTIISFAYAQMYDFLHYNMESNPNCKSLTTLYLLGGRNDSRIADNEHTCCKFQQQVTTSPELDDHRGMNEFSVMLGQTYWSHDTAITNTISNGSLILSCPDDTTLAISSMERQNGEIKTFVTSCLDGSMLYGRDQDTLEFLSTQFPQMDMFNGEPPSPTTCPVRMANPLHFD